MTFVQLVRDVIVRDGVIARNLWVLTSVTATLEENYRDDLSYDIDNALTVAS